ncbi:hypothetical protein [Clostridium tunisiense]|uniref:hypothetical protein n=1 Tax=Clostridium tunisiense TaxID=219748 RepID=UPI00030847D9|nr:hypothetical protein [Clostridium tunisiense]
MRTKFVEVIDTDGKVYQYNGVKTACLECDLPIWYGIYSHRTLPKKYEETFSKIALVKVDDVIRHEKK